MRGRPRKLYQMADINTNQSEDEIEDNDEDTIYANMITDQIPETWDEVVRNNEVETWQAALEDEYLALLKHKTWEIVERPHDRKVIGNRLVLQSKENNKKKVRLVAKGCAQRFGVDYIETYSPVVKMTSIRLLSAIAAEKDLEIHQIDVITAYLNSEINEQVYMEVPAQLNEILSKIIKGVSIGTSSKIIEEENTLRTAKNWLQIINNEKNNVCLLKRALYGLKQSGVQWYKTIHNELIKINLKPFLQDKCLFFMQEKEKLLMLAIYVDDILIASNNGDWIYTVKNKLTSRFAMKDIGLVDKCLGIKFEQNLERHEIQLTQVKYVKQLLEKFEMSECKPASTPMEINCDLPYEKESVNKNEHIPYQKLIGALLYLAISTRPDISYAVSYLSQFNNCYQEVHWKAAKRVLIYLKGTSNYAILYKQSEMKLKGMVDAISWESKKQRTVALSSTEAEYMAISEAIRELLYLQGFLIELNFNCDQIYVENDSQSAQKLIWSQSINSRSKHIDVRHHFIKQIVEQGSVIIKYVPTNEMSADVLTKSLSAPKHRNCLMMMRINM